MYCLLCRQANLGADLCDLRDGKDLPVQGPINKEPPEKLNPDRNGKTSIIRRMLVILPLKIFDEND